MVEEVIYVAPENIGYRLFAFQDFCQGPKVIRRSVLTAWNRRIHRRQRRRHGPLSIMVRN